MASLADTFQRALNNKHVKFGLPFFILMAAGVFGIKEFASIKYEFRRNETLDPYSIEGVAKKKRGEVTIESEFEKVQKEVDINNWENIRGPRLWDETPQNYQNPKV